MTSVDWAIRISSLSKRFGGLLAIDNVSMEIGSGEFLMIVGPSGCGKTTLLRILAGLIGQYDGEVKIRGTRLVGPTRSIGVAFQDANLLPWRSVLDNVLLPAQVLRLDMPASRRRANELLALVGLQGFERKLPHELSGGMRQRVSIARSSMTPRSCCSTSRSGRSTRSPATT
jgi:NitT/TauT family transport system ATP-binding protein